MQGRKQIAAIVAATAVAGAQTAAAAATAETATLAADDRELKKPRADSKAAEEKAKSGTGNAEHSPAASASSDIS